MERVSFSAAGFGRNIGRYQDIALRQPVAVTRNGRERTVLISTEEYVRLRGFHCRRYRGPGSLAPTGRSLGL